MKLTWRIAVGVVLGVFGWLWVLLRLLPSLLRGRAVLPRGEVEPVPDPTSVEQRAEGAAAVATAQAEEAKAPHLAEVAETAAVVEAVPKTDSRRKRRELLQRLADKVDKP